MLLILEIMLTISAWRRGYGALALIPIGLALFIGFLIGSNNPELVESGDILSFVWLDILAVVVLVVMIATAKKPVDEEVKKGQEVSEIENYEEPVPEAQDHKYLTTSQCKSKIN